MKTGSLIAKTVALAYDIRIRVWMIGYTIKLEGLALTIRSLAQEILNRKRPRHCDIRGRSEVVTVALKDIRRIGMPSLGYLAITQRFREGRSWEDTLYGLSARRDLLRKGWTRRPEFDSWEAFGRELCKWDSVYQDIERNGFRSVKNNMMVTRDLTFIDGKHRLAMAHVLELEKIVVTIVDVDAKSKTIRSRESKAEIA